MQKVDELAHEAGIEIAIFAKTDHAGSMYSNIRDIEEAGSVIAAGIMHSLKDTEIPENASRFMDVIIAAAAHSIDAMKGLQNNIIEHVVTNNK